MYDVFIHAMTPSLRPYTYFDILVLTVQRHEASRGTLRLLLQTPHEFLNAKNVLHSGVAQRLFKHFHFAMETALV